LLQLALTLTSFKYLFFVYKTQPRSYTMDGISTSRDLQASHGYTNERSLAKPRGSEPGDTQEQPQGAKEVYRVPSALGDWWILNLLLNWFFLFFIATPRPSPDQPQKESPERQVSPQPSPPRGGTNITYDIKGGKNYGVGSHTNFSGASFS